MSSFYDKDGPWSAPGRQTSWEQQQQQSQASAQQQQQQPQPSQQQTQPPPAPPSRSGTSSSLSQQSDSNAFASQFEEIERATDNLMKSGKWAPGQNQGGGGAASRRESLPAMGRGFDYSSDPRMGGGPPSSRHQSVTEFEGGRPGSAGLQGYYAGQRFPGGRQSEAEQMLQNKRRMAAQRERELRNYHQEQQYNRISGAKPDRAMSPTTMSEEDRRELIARQHRALYGDSSTLYGSGSDGSGARPPPGQDVRGSSVGRGPSPLAYDPFAVPGQPGGVEGAVQMPPRDRAESTASPASNPPTQPTFGLLGDAQPSSRTSVSSPGGSPPLTQGPKGSNAPSGGVAVAPIGTRPAAGPGSAGGLNKRSTTPLTPSSLSYGFNASDGSGASNNGKDERATSASVNNPSIAPSDKAVGGLGSWGNSSGAWGSGKSTLAVQPSVWG